jgi:hypothetical protein
VPILPAAGFSYIFKWNPECRNEKDWRSDGYRWVQGATKTVTSKSGAKCTKYYFKTQVAKRSVTDDSFQKRVSQIVSKPSVNKILRRRKKC